MKGQSGNDLLLFSYSADSAALSCSMDNKAYNYVKQFHDDSFKLGQNTDGLRSCRKWLFLLLQQGSSIQAELSGWVTFPYAMSLSSALHRQVSHIANKQKNKAHNRRLVMWLNEYHPSDVWGSEEVLVRVRWCVWVTLFPERKSCPVFSSDDLMLQFP